MRKLQTAFRFIGCLFGGSVCASLLLMVVSLCVFGWHDPDRFVGFLSVANPIAGVVGALGGAMIFIRSARHP